jgi:hypothetical protein
VTGLAAASVCGWEKLPVKWAVGWDEAQYEKGRGRGGGAIACGIDRGGGALNREKSLGNSRAFDRTVVDIALSAARNEPRLIGGFAHCV